MENKPQTVLQKLIYKMRREEYLTKNILLEISSETLIDKIIKIAESLLEEEKKQTIDFAHRAVNSWSMCKIPIEEIEKLYPKPKEKREAILFTGTVESANQVIMFTDGRAVYSQTKETIETQKVGFVHLFNGSSVPKDCYVVRNVFDIETSKSAFSVMRKDIFESQFDLK